MSRRSWGWPLALLLAVLVAIPIIEVYLLVLVGRQIGPLPTIAILVVEAVVGAWLIRREGRRAWAALQGALGRGSMPSRELADAALVLLGGAMFMLPGFFTDIIGLICLVPFTRPLARGVIAWFAARQAERHGIDVSTVRRPPSSDVIEGEVVPDAPQDQRAVEGRVIE